ncbi:MAG TPA: D-alanyl-D-alanine carboxypeptidase family protein [Anaerolineae bacterium]|mgnify:CR=1 FL=1|nr:D-alanyl-D-alanine carboxypeptidase family protein [Anaerolineae bacterium]
MSASVLSTAIWTALLSLTALLNVALGPPVLRGGQPGAAAIFPEQIAAQQTAQTLPTITAPEALLADSATGQVLGSINATQPRAMASTTKIMTALLVLERANLSDIVTVSPTALVGEASMGLEAGESLTVEDLLWGLLLRSGNDAAVALAEHVAGSEEAFVDLMNQRAAELGLTDTHFANPHGLDADNHYSSAQDLWRLAELAMANPVFRTMVATQSHEAAGRELFNINDLLGYYPGADGIKTGTSDAAGQCLVGSYSQDGFRTIAVVLGSQDRYSDTATLFDFSQEQYRREPAPEPTGLTSWIRAADGQPLRVTAPERPWLFLPAWQWPLLRSQFVSNGAPPVAGQSIGEVRWYLGNQLLASAPALASEY